MVVNNPSLIHQLVEDRAQRYQAEADRWRLARSARSSSIETVEPKASAPARRRLRFRAVTRASEPTPITPSA
jgi:hypothetical protein